MSPRAAWRLESLGFENVCDYIAGKKDWLAHELPIEGQLAHTATIGQMAHREVPVCRLDETLSDVAERLRPTSWHECIAVNEAGIVLGLLQKSTWDGAQAGTLVEQAMEAGPSTYRPHMRSDEMLKYMEEKKIKNALVTTSEGKLIGLVRRKDLELGSKG